MRTHQKSTDHRGYRLYSIWIGRIPDRELSSTKVAAARLVLSNDQALDYEVELSITTQNYFFFKLKKTN